VRKFRTGLVACALTGAGLVVCVLTGAGLGACAPRPGAEPRRLRSARRRAGSL